MALVWECPAAFKKSWTATNVMPTADGRFKIYPASGAPFVVDKLEMLNRVSAYFESFSEKREAASAQLDVKPASG